MPPTDERGARAAARVLLVAVLLLVAGAAVGLGDAAPGDDVEGIGPDVESTAIDFADDEPGPAGPDYDERPDDPDDDTIGYWNGTWYDDEIDVDQADGLSDEELDAWTDRSMARVEYVRGLAFEEDVDVEVLTREEYVDEYVDDPPWADEYGEEYWDWNAVTWRAMFVVGDDADLEREFRAVRADAVGGLYDVEGERLVVIADDPDDLAVEPSILLHELLHALQDQHFDLSTDDAGPPTQDEQLAADGLVEGDAVYLEAVYEELCATEWDCVGAPEAVADAEPPAEPPAFNLGLWVTIFQPYSDGPQYVAEILAEEGWEGLDERFAEPPTATSEIIHPELEGERPEPMEFEDTAEDGWEPFDEGDDGADRVGEAGVYAAFWYQTVERGIPIVDPNAFVRPDGEYETYEYTSPMSEGWTNDRLVAYERGDEIGFVWQLQWETDGDARAFAEAYELVLRGHGAQEVDDGTWELGGEEFPGAYRVDVDGSTATIVHGPELEDLSDLRPGIGAPEEAEDGDEGADAD